MACFIVPITSINLDYIEMKLTKYEKYHKCICGGNKYYCKKENCNGKYICIHKINKQLCKECFGNRLCALCLERFTRTGLKTCKRCYNKTVGKEYLSEQEKTVGIFLSKYFPQLHFQYNYRINIQSCPEYKDFGRSIDFYTDTGLFAIVVENDEKQHKDRIIICEENREMDIVSVIGGLPVLII